VVHTVVQDPDGSATAVVQPTEPAPYARDAGRPYPGPVDPVQRPDAVDFQASSSVYSDALSITEHACDAAIR
jgi:hypothetical protein